MIFIPIALIFLMLAAYLLYKKYRPQWERNRILKNNDHLLEDIKKIAKSNVTGFANLNSEEKDQFIKSVLIFTLEKSWSSDFSTEEKYLEAFKACRPILHRPSNYYPGIRVIEKPKPFTEWLKFHEQQFSIEKGSLALKELPKDFVTLSEMFFYEQEELKRQYPQSYQKLWSYYRPQTPLS